MRLLLAIALLIPAFSGCAVLDEIFDPRPTIPVSRTELVSGWNRVDTFTVTVLEAELREVRIEATSATEKLETIGLGNATTPVSLQLMDGVWTVVYWVDGYKWETFRDVAIDNTLPQVNNLERIGNAQNRAYTIGATAAVESGVVIRVYDDGELVSDKLPYSVSGLADGLHPYLVEFEDEAGNVLPITVQVRAGDAKFLPEGEHAFGIVARYTNELRLWDISNLASYPSPADARATVAGFTGTGYGITPNEAVIQGVVDDVVAPGSTTGEIALDLYMWLADNLEYDVSRLATNTLMTPKQVIQDSESPSDNDANDDGIVDSGAGNGVAGGVCRDLAGTYVSLLRAAGVPARVVTGYLAGNVDGFHAWVEFYGDEWIPVDVSLVGMSNVEGDDEYTPQYALQAFGILRPDYLPLRANPAPEGAGWSTAMSAQFEYPAASAKPVVKFADVVEVQGVEDTSNLCVNEDTLERWLASDATTCLHIPNYVTFSERIIDYGIVVQSADSGTTIDGQVVYPFASASGSNGVEYIVYAQSGKWTKDSAAGTVNIQFTV